MSLILAKLMNVQRLGGGEMRCGCPACMENGADSKHQHLRIFADGAYGCAMDQTPEHYGRVFALVGEGSKGEPVQEIAPPQIEMERIWPINTLDRLAKDHSYWLGRGISEETVVPFRGGVATEFQMKGRYVFPIFEHDEIIGFSGRRLDDKPEMKWKHLGRTTRWIWGGLDEIAARAILVESIGDSLALREHDVPESLCLFGTNLSPTLLGYLITINPEQIVISTNRDTHEVGQKAAEKIKKTLDKFFNTERIVITLPPEGVKDWGKATKEQIQLTFNP